MSKAPLGHNRTQYVVLQVNLQTHIFVPVSAKHSFDTLIMGDLRCTQISGL